MEMDIIEEKDKNVTFATKGENPMKLILKFKEGVVITNGSSFSVTFDQSVSSNGKLDIFKLSVTPIY